MAVQIPIDRQGNSVVLTDPAKFAPAYQVLTHRITNDGAVSTRQMLTPNSQRVAIIFNNALTFRVAFDIDPTEIGPNSLLLLDVARPFTMTFEDFGTLVHQSWYAAPGGAPWTICVTEIIYRPELCK